MKSIKKPRASQEIPKKYEELVKLFMPRPIHDKVELSNATEIADMLAGHDLNPEQEDYYDLVTDLIDGYESEHHPIRTRKFSGIEILRYLLDENGMNATDLARLLHCDRTLGPKILSGERQLTANHIKILCVRFKASADLFLR
ncbi:MAG: transcriptional regulator [Verrucomicrobia bacterium]|nr:transcriptional regulator [Verrucomicrobiota bacterium]